jgi:hypothetical protein
MILLRPDCLAFESPGCDAELRPAEAVAIEVAGDAAALHADAIKEAAAAVMHYFQNDLGRTTVSVAEFSVALKKALQGLGLDVEVTPPAGERGEETDLQTLLQEGSGAELVFFPRLRAELRRRLERGPAVLRFRGLRGCVKQLLGARRWSPRCQTMNDQILDYMRTCLEVDRQVRLCALLVR